MDCYLRLILQNNKQPFELTIDPDTGEYGYKKVGADAVTPFKTTPSIDATYMASLGNAEANADKEIVGNP